MSNDTIPVRKCSKCGEEKPLTREYFYPNKSSAQGYRTDCKTCNSNRSKEHYASNREVRSQRSKAYYQAHQAETILRTRAYYQANREHALARQRQYYLDHKDYIDARNRDWMSKNEERMQTYYRRWRAENREWKRSYNREWYAANRDRLRLNGIMYRMSNKSKILDRVRRWRKENPERKRVNDANRRARLMQAEGRFTKNDVRQIYANQNGRCAYCQIGLNNTYHIDHIQPLSRGGSNYPDNLACACPHCNTSKHDKTVEEWIATRGW